MDNKKRSRVSLSNAVKIKTSVDNLQYIDTNPSFYHTQSTERNIGKKIYNFTNFSSFNTSNNFMNTSSFKDKKDLLTEFQPVDTFNKKQMFITGTNFRKKLPCLGKIRNSNKKEAMMPDNNLEINIDNQIKINKRYEIRNKAALVDLEETEKENYDKAVCDDLETIHLKHKVRSFIREKLNNMNYWASSASSKKDKFYDKKENKVNFLEDGMNLPHIRNNLFSINERSIGGVENAFATYGGTHHNQTSVDNRYKRANATLKEKFEHLKHPNTIDKNLNLYLNELKRQYQSEKDNLSTIYKISKFTEIADEDFKDRIEKNYQQYYSNIDETFGNIKTQNDYYHYFTNKYEKYDKIDIAEGRVREIILHIDPKHKVKNLANKIFGLFLINKFEDIKEINLEEIIEEHIKHELLHKKCRIYNESPKVTRISNKETDFANKRYFSHSRSVSHSRRNSKTKSSPDDAKKDNNLKSFNTMKNILKILYNDSGNENKLNKPKTNQN